CGPFCGPAGATPTSWPRSARRWTPSPRATTSRSGGRPRRSPGTCRRREGRGLGPGASVRSPARPGRLARTGVRPAALLGRRAEAGAGRRRRPAGRGAGRTGSAGLHRPADRARRCGALGQVRGRLPAADERRMIRLSTEPFEPGALLTSFAQGRSETGAVTTFTGIARAEKGGTQILELEAYPGFTEAEIGKIADRARTRWALDDLLIVH